MERVTLHFHLILISSIKQIGKLDGWSSVQWALTSWWSGPQSHPNGSCDYHTRKKQLLSTKAVLSRVTASMHLIACQSATSRGDMYRAWNKSLCLVVSSLFLLLLSSAWLYLGPALQDLPNFNAASSASSQSLRHFAAANLILIFTFKLHKGCLNLVILSSICRI